MCELRVILDKDGEWGGRGKRDEMDGENEMLRKIRLGEDTG